MLDQRTAAILDLLRSHSDLTKEMMKLLKNIPYLFLTLWLFCSMLQGGNTPAMAGNLSIMDVAGPEDSSFLTADKGSGSESPSLMEIRNLPDESVFVDTDRDIYFAGDHLFFKVYLVVDGQRANPLQSKVVYLSLGSESGNQLYKLELPLEGSNAQGSIRLADTLQTGVYRFSAWTNNMLIADTPPFTRQLTVLNRFDPEIRGFIMDNNKTPEPEGLPLQVEAYEEVHPSIPAGRETIALKADKQSYGPREQVRLRIDPVRDFTGMASASLSVSREETLLLNAPRMATTFSAPGEAGGSGSGKEQPEMLILPENLGSVISGRVVDNGTGRALSDAVVFLSAVDSLSNLKYSRTRADGSFFFLLDDYHHGKMLYISVFEAGDSHYTPRIKMREKFPATYFIPHKMAMHPSIHAYLEELLLVRRARRAYQTEGFGFLYEEHEATFSPPPVLYGQPTHRIYTRDYLPMDDLSEMSIEILPDLRIRKQGGGYTTRMIDSGSSTFFPDAPVFFLNGVWLPAIDKIAGLSSEEITRVEVLSRHWAFGSLEFYGIVGIFTMEDLYQIPSHPATKIIEGSPVRRKVRFDPAPHAGEFRQEFPDYREVLYWEPSIRLQSGRAVDLSFTTSDLPGNYVISLEGFTECGIAFSQTKIITVE